MTIPQVIRDAVRPLLRAPLFSTVAVSSLTLSVGAVVAAFSLLNALVLQQRPVRDPQTLAQVTTINQLNQESGLSWSAFHALSRQEVFSATLGWIFSGVLNVQIGSSRERLGVGGVSGGFFNELGIAPAAGRLISEADIDERSEHSSAVAVIGWSLWHRHFGGEQSAIGGTIEVEGQTLTVIGVVPKGFTGMTVTLQPDVIVPLPLVPHLLGEPERLLEGPGGWVNVTARLQPKQSLQAARAELTAVWPHLLNEAVPATLVGASRDRFLNLRVDVRSGANGVERSLRATFSEPLSLLLAIAVLLLAATAVSLCALAYSRAEHRIHEIRVRLALGASRQRLIAESVFEGVAIGVVTWPLVLWTAYQVSATVSRAIFQDYLVTAGLDVTPNARVMAIGFLSAVLGGIGMTVLPAVVVGGRASQELRSSGTRTIARSGRSGTVLLTVQVALSIVLLAATSLLVRNAHAVTTTDSGMRTEGVLIGHPEPPAGGYGKVDAASYYPQALTRLMALGGVESAAFTLLKPAGGWLPFEAVGRAADPSNPSADVAAMATQVSPGFFATLGIRLLQGRDFAFADDYRSRPVVIISRSLSTALFGDRSPLGEHLRVGTQPHLQNLEVVGVVADARVYDVRLTNLHMAYTPSLQNPDANWKTLVVRAPLTRWPDIRKTIESLGVEQLSRMQSLEYVASRTLLKEKMLAAIAAYFGGLVMVLVAVGVFAQMSHLVTSQRKEIGIRLALGAEGRWMARHIVGRSLLVTAAGTALGLPAAIASSALLRSVLTGTTPYDPVAWALAPILLLFVALTGVAIPAIHAASVEPVVELRRD